MHILLVVLLFSSFQSIAQEKSIEEVVVYGVRPGPDLWKVTKGENVLWVLGTLSPLPKRMKWQSEFVETVIKNSQAYVIPPSVSVDIGFFQAFSLARSAIGIKKNPGKKQLKDIVPEATYARWLLLKKKYLGNNRKIEKTRPIFASSKLFDKAISKIGLTYDTKVEKKVSKMAKKNKLEFIRPTIKIDMSKSKSAIKKFKKTNISDLECFSKTLDTLESDVNNMSKRASAWANGDVSKLIELQFANQEESCTSAILNNDFAKDVGMENIKERLRALWLEKVEESLNTNKSTFAILSIANLLGENSYLRSLEAKGYLVEIPK